MTQNEVAAWWEVAGRVDGTFEALAIVSGYMTQAAMAKV